MIGNVDWTYPYLTKRRWLGYLILTEYSISISGVCLWPRSALWNLFSPDHEKLEIVFSGLIQNLTEEQSRSLYWITKLRSVASSSGGLTRFFLDNLTELGFHGLLFRKILFANPVQRINFRLFRLQFSY